MQTHTLSFLLGLDIGSSSVKAALVDAESLHTVAAVQSDEMTIESPKAGWAEQEPEMWWTHVCQATKSLLAKTGVNPDRIKSIGIAYQMHGLVCVDKNQQALRPAIIWCDSRAVEIGARAFDEIGHEECLKHYLNSPGNFTASKLKWVKDHEPEIYQRIHKVMLPGDFIAMKLTGETLTTPTGLSEGILWDYSENQIGSLITDHFGFDQSLFPDITPVVSLQGNVNAKAAQETGLLQGTPLTYRAGDQPNNALALGVIQPGEVAASGGTSGVVYGVVDNYTYDPQSRVNGFLHVNHTRAEPRVGILLCINGAGSQYGWIKHHIAQSGTSYHQMEREAANIPPGSGGLCMIPFGNGAERMLGNVDIGAHILNLDFNRHSRAHVYRAALEGIAFAFVYGIEMLKELGVQTNVIRAGNDNLFQSEIFSSIIASLADCRIDIVETTGAVGAAKASAVGVGLYSSIDEVMQDVLFLKSYQGDYHNEAYRKSYDAWEYNLMRIRKHNECRFP